MEECLYGIVGFLTGLVNIFQIIQRAFFIALPIQEKTSFPPLFSFLIVCFSLIDEEFEMVSTQLLKRTQAMLNKYRLLLLEESRVSFFSLVEQV